MDTSKPLLEVNNLTVIQNDHTILKNVSFEIEAGSTVALIGPNGAGKTTIFKSILGFTPYTGTITWSKKVNIGYVPQRLYVENDLPFSTQEFLSTKDANKEAIQKALATVGLTDSQILSTPLGALSGGELQRVLIAWALIGKPDILLFDEPTSGVDMVGEDTIYSLLMKLKKDHNLTIILISHELDIVYKYATHVICINKETVSTGTPAKALTKQTLDKLFGDQVTIYHQPNHS
jgi:zinc transport system ATP-binding protein